MEYFGNKCDLGWLSGVKMTIDGTSYFFTSDNTTQTETGNNDTKDLATVVLNEKASLQKGACTITVETDPYRNSGTLALESIKLRYSDRASLTKINIEGERPTKVTNASSEDCIIQTDSAAGNGRYLLLKTSPSNTPLYIVYEFDVPLAGDYNVDFTSTFFKDKTWISMGEARIVDGSFEIPATLEEDTAEYYTLLTEENGGQLKEGSLIFNIKDISDVSQNRLNQPVYLTAGKKSMVIRVQKPEYEGSEWAYAGIDRITLEPIFDMGEAKLKLDRSMISQNSGFKARIEGANKVEIDTGQFDSITWTTDNENIASVDEDGEIKGINPGKTTVRADIIYQDKSYSLSGDIAVSKQRCSDA